MDGVADTHVEIELQAGMRFSAVGDDGVTLALDASADHGGVGEGLRPLEAMLAALGSCTAMDVISILRKKRQDVTSYRIDVSARQADTHPRVFTHISITHTFRGTNLVEDAIARAIELSEAKYCPAFAMLSKAAPIESSWEIQPPAPID